MRRFLLVAVLFGSSLFGTLVDDGLKQVSFIDKIFMRIFFAGAVEQSQIAHVLHFKTKPISLIAKAIRNSTHNYLYDTLCIQGWNAFKKHEHLFPHPQFLFNENTVQFADEFTVLHLYLINIEAVEICLQNHLTTFKKILGEEFAIAPFIERLKQGDSITSLLCKDEMLMGILLGFGEESSQAYKEGPLHCREEREYCCIDLKKPKGCTIQPVIFLGNPSSPEVKDLGKIYEQEMEEIAKIYGKKKSLKMILEKLCEP